MGHICATHGPRIVHNYVIGLPWPFASIMYGHLYGPYMGPGAVKIIENNWESLKTNGHNVRVQGAENHWKSFKIIETHWRITSHIWSPGYWKPLKIQENPWKSLSFFENHWTMYGSHAPYKSFIGCKILLWRHSCEVFFRSARLGLRVLHTKRLSPSNPFIYYVFGATSGLYMWVIHKPYMGHIIVNVISHI